MAQPKVYVETSVVSYLVGRPSRDLVTAGHQQITHQWWERRAESFDLCSSSLVVEEASRGNREFAARRLEVITSLSLLAFRAEAGLLARSLMGHGVLPKKAEADAAHIALAAVHKIDYLLTWNCKHIANAEIQPVLERICRTAGYLLPILCTPEQLMGKG
ncbi:MAG TPA: type II toxin-antitoxin system VapC family toxin [Longimicrobiaceae bacterium]|jgi:hypothetical protein|nr:type II toxin-antitoxin system VapC family toxin [Longimicrobiaceae bacterium]